MANALKRFLQYQLPREEGLELHDLSLESKLPPTSTARGAIIPLG